jgi:hypothetical protein
LNLLILNTFFSFPFTAFLSTKLSGYLVVLEVAKDAIGSYPSQGCTS